MFDKIYHVSKINYVRIIVSIKLYTRKTLGLRIHECNNHTNVIIVHAFLLEFTEYYRAGE